jgi:ethanolamine utilization protein EutN
MRIGKVIGNLTLVRWNPSLGGATYKLAIPLTRGELRDGAAPKGEELVVYDDMNASPGDTIAISEGGEAAQPFEPDMKPIDAYNAAILDQLNIAV